MTDNRSLWELVEELRESANVDWSVATNKDWAEWVRDRANGSASGKRHAAEKLAAILEHPVVVGEDSLVVRNPAPHAADPLVGTPQVTLNIGALGQPDSDWIIRRMHEKSFESGWRVACDWAKRADMIYDIDSPAYNRDRDRSLESMVRGKS